MDSGYTMERREVIVAGGGPAGIGAALAAARHGADTLLLEKHGFLGGIASFSLGMPMNQMRPGGQPRGAIHEDILARLQAFGPQAVRPDGHCIRCNVEYLKVVLADALKSAGVDCLLHTPVIDVIRRGNSVRGVVVATKNGPARIPAKAVVDGTGDADVARFAGAETLKEEGGLSPMTLCLTVGSRHPDKVAAFVRAGGLREVARLGRERYPLLPERWGPARYTSDCAFYINHSGTKGFGIFDGTDPAQLTEAECFSRRQALQMVQAMREFGGDALADVELLGTGPQVGVRETRRVRGLYVLTEEDAKQGAAFEDAVAWRSGFLDIGFVRYEPMKVHDVPLRALIPATVDGLLAAGRCISATHVAASAGKSMGNCVATGHAAGVVAALSALRGIPPRMLGLAPVREALERDGVRFDRAGDAQEGLRE